MSRPEAEKKKPSGEASDPSLLNRLAWSCRWTDRERSVSFAEAARDWPYKTGSPRARKNRGRACLTLAWQAKFRGEFDTSLKFALEAEQLLTEKNFPTDRAHTYATLSVLHSSKGRIDLAKHALDRGMLLADIERDRSAYIELLTADAGVLMYRGDKGRAGLTLGRAEQLAVEAEQAMVQVHIARWLLSDGCPEKAVERAARGVNLAEEHKCRVLEPYAHEVMGQAKYRLGHFKQAEAFFTTGLEIAQADGDKRAECHLMLGMGLMERARKETDQALRHFRQGAKMASRLGYVPWQIIFARECAAEYERRGDMKAALNEHRVAWALTDKRRY
ncbi:MAG: hypothetical protein AAF762_05375 [Pseudomonadota bacterium]